MKRNEISAKPREPSRGTAAVGPGAHGAGAEAPAAAANSQGTGASGLQRRLFRDRLVLCVQEVAQDLRITRQHVIRLIEEGRMDAINVNGIPGRRNCWRIPIEAYQAFLKQRDV